MKPSLHFHFIINVAIAEDGRQGLGVVLWARAHFLVARDPARPQLTTLGTILQWWNMSAVVIAFILPSSNLFSLFL